MALTRRQRIWYFLQQQLRSNKLRQIIGPSITALQKSAAIGDSITFQFSTTNATNFILNAIGYPVMLNYKSGRRFPINIADNYGVSGDNLANMDARKAAMAGKGYTSIFFLGGANDITAVTTQAAMEASAKSIINYITGTLGAVAIVLLVMPRTQDDGSQLTLAQQTKLTNHNNMLMGLHNGTTVIVCDTNSPMVIPGTTYPEPTFFKDEAGKRLHPTALGSEVAGFAVDARVAPIFGRLPAPAVGAILPVGNFSGTTGVLSTNASGVIATGWTGSGSGGTGGRVFAKNADGSQRVTVNLPNGAGSSASVTLQATGGTTTGYSIGDTVYGWLDIEMHSGSFADGPYLECRDVGTTTINQIGMNKAGGTSGNMPLNQMGRGLITTPNFTIQASNTRLDFLIRGQVNASGQAASMDFTVFAGGFMKV